MYNSYNPAPMKPSSSIHSVYLGVLAFFGFGLILGCPMSMAVGWVASILHLQEDASHMSGLERGLSVCFLVGITSAILVIRGNRNLHNSRGRALCGRCGYKLQDSMIYCPECGGRIDDAKSKV